MCMWPGVHQYSLQRSDKNYDFQVTQIFKVCFVIWNDSSRDIHGSYIKSPNNSHTQKIAVITLKFEQGGFTVEKDADRTAQCRS